MEVGDVTIRGIVLIDSSRTRHDGEVGVSGMNCIGKSIESISSIGTRMCQ